MQQCEIHFLNCNPVLIIEFKLCILYYNSPVHEQRFGKLHQQSLQRSGFQTPYNAADVLQRLQSLPGAWIGEQELQRLHDGAAWSRDTEGKGRGASFGVNVSMTGQSDLDR